MQCLKRLPSYAQGVPELLPETTYIDEHHGTKQVIIQQQTAIQRDQKQYAEDLPHFSKVLYNAVQMQDQDQECV